MTPLDILWYSRGSHPSPLGLAAQLGWFLDEFRDDGIRVFTVQDSTDAALRDAHLDHHLPNTIRQGGNVPALWARSRGARTRLIALSWMDEFQGILVRPDGDLDEVAALHGARLALPVCGNLVDSTRTEALHGFLVTLKGVGLRPQDVQFVDVAADRFRASPVGRSGTGPYGEYARQLGALARREVDAVYVKGARGLQAARSAQARVLLDLREQPDPAARVHTGTPRPITVDQALLDQHPEVVERFLARVLDAGAWARRHAQETVAYLARETRSDEDWVVQAYGADVHQQLGSDLSARSVQALQQHQRFLLDWGFITHEVDIGAWIDPAPLAAAQARSEAQSDPAALLR